jgi:hypothetical protein
MIHQEKVNSWKDNPKELVDRINASMGRCELLNSGVSNRPLTIWGAELRFEKHVILFVGKEIAIFEGIDEILFK